jgi:dTDP-glucose pyrophosphorylase
MNILVPMAGEGSRFVKAGYTTPKPLIKVFDKTMIEMVIENNIYPDEILNFIFICRTEHLSKYPIEETINKAIEHEQNMYAPYGGNLVTSKIVTVDELTEGAACTVLKARKLIDTDEALVIANSDQYIFWNTQHFLKMINITGVDGAIPVFHCTHPKWSYVTLDEDGFVTQLKEKEVISTYATVGIYYFKHGKDFVWAADRMINKNIRTNNEFYVAPVYNELIVPENYKVLAYPIPAKAMGRLGTPEDLEDFKKYYDVKRVR